MNNLFLIFISVFLFNNDTVSYIEGRDFKGYIFSKEHYVFMTIENQRERFTPTTDEIRIIENRLKKKIKCENKNKENQYENCPIIHKKLNNYTRQYVGFINNKSEKIIWINCIWSKNVNNEILKKEIFLTSDGCSYYWNIKINLKTEELFDLEINGKS